MTIEDVAIEAGVSTATVSRVLNKRPGVSEGNVLRVTQAMTVVGYELKEVRPGPKPRLVSQAAAETGCLGLVMLGRYHEVLQHPLIVRLVAEIRSAMREQGYHLLLEEMNPEEDTCPAIEEKRLEGAFVITAAKGSHRRLAGMSTRLPLVHILGAGYGSTMVDHVSVNNRLVGEVAFESLRGKGVKQVVFVDVIGSREREFCARGRAFRDAALEVGMPVRQFCVASDGVEPGPFYAEETMVGRSQEDVVKQLLQKSEAPVGLFFATDDQLAAVVPELDKGGWQVGRDYEVVGCGNVASFLDPIFPRPATIDINVAEMARQGVQCLTRRIREPGVSAVEVLVAPSLVAGDESMRTSNLKRRRMRIDG